MLPCRGCRKVLSLLYKRNTWLACITHPQQPRPTLAPSKVPNACIGCPWLAPTLAHIMLPTCYPRTAPTHFHPTHLPPQLPTCCPPSAPTHAVDHRAPPQIWGCPPSAPTNLGLLTERPHKFGAAHRAPPQIWGCPPSAPSPTTPTSPLLASLSYGMCRAPSHSTCAGHVACRQSTLVWAAGPLGACRAPC